MNNALPVLTPREAIRAFSRAGFSVLPNRGKGSHTVMAKAGWPAILTIPDHAELKRGTLRSLIRDAGLTVEQFRALLD